MATKAIRQTVTFHATSFCRFSTCSWTHDSMGRYPGSPRI